MMAFEIPGACSHSIEYYYDTMCSILQYYWEHSVNKSTLYFNVGLSLVSWTISLGEGATIGLQGRDIGIVRHDIIT